MYDSFEDVKVGDVLIMHGRNDVRVVKVARVTAKQFVTERPECKFWKKDGSEVGGSIWHRAHIAKGTDDELVEIHDRNRKRGKVVKVRNLLANKNLTVLSEHDLDVILEILNKHKEE